MSGAITLNGIRVISGSITIPYYGAWVADVVLADSTTIPTSVSLVVGDLTLIGTVVRQASFAASRSARIVGGAAGWRKELPSRGYSHIAGVKLSTVVGDAANECGERIVLASDLALGTHYARDAGTAQRVLEIELNGTWWIDPLGVTQTKDRDSSPVVSPFTVLSWSGGKGQFEIASESIATWQPGRTFTSVVVEGTQQVSSITIDVDNEGKARLHILSTNGTKERLRESIRSIIKQEISTLSYAGVWEYTIAVDPIAPGLVSTIDATPTDSRMPPLTGVPLVGMGLASPPITGTTCRIRFVNSDPARPECFALGDATEHVMTVEATALLIYNTFSTLALAFIALGAAPTAVSSVLGVVIQPLITPAILAALAAQAIPAPPGLIAQIAAAAAQSAAMIAGTAPGNTCAPFAAPMALVGTKLPDVSGLFPGLGVPNG